MSKVSPLQKISLSLRQEMVQLPGNEETCASFTFIYGAGSTGLSPFELDLSGKMVGETFSLNVVRGELSVYLEHLYRPLLNVLELPAIPGDLVLEGVVTTVEQPQEREIITAMKEYLGGGCGGGCNCGCQ